MRLIEALEEGRIERFGCPDRIIDTLLSKLFFFGPKVIKVYKHEKAFYGDLGDFTFRKNFYSEVFFWNHEMSPDIYLNLAGVKNNRQFTPTDISQAEDFFIEMRAIDSDCNLTNLLISGKVSANDAEALTEELVSKLRVLTKDRQEKLSHLFALGWMKLQQQDLEDLRQWVYMMGDDLEKAEADRAVISLEKRAAALPYFTAHDRSLLSVNVDNNSDNILLLKGVPGFIDIMPPKENWRAGDEYFNIVRTAVDMAVLGGDMLRDAVYAAYTKHRAPAPREVTLVYEIRSALIQWAYRRVLKQDAVAEKYKTFALKGLRQLEMLLIA